MLKRDYFFFLCLNLESSQNFLKTMNLNDLFWLEIAENENYRLFGEKVYSGKNPFLEFWDKKLLANQSDCMII